jgi:hypothetical protein
MVKVFIVFNLLILQIFIGVVAHLFLCIKILDEINNWLLNAQIK